jgi:hypothetical protein
MELLLIDKDSPITLGTWKQYIKEVHGLKFMVPCEIMELARLLCKGYKLPSSMLPHLSKILWIQ